MAQLRAVMAAIGYQDVLTLLNSGNAVFGATSGAPAKHAKAIAAAISSKLGVDVPVIVKSANEFGAIVDENPLAGIAPDHSRLLVVFAQDSKALSALTALESLVDRTEQFVVSKNAAYLHCAGGILESKAGKALLGKAGDAVTSRNWKTVLKLNALSQ